MFTRRKKELEAVQKEKNDATKRHDEALDNLLRATTELLTRKEQQWPQDGQSSQD